MKKFFQKKSEPFHRMTAAEARKIPFDESVLKGELKRIYGGIKLAAAKGESSYLWYYGPCFDHHVKVVRILIEDGFEVTQGNQFFTKKITWKENCDVDDYECRTGAQADAERGSGGFAETDYIWHCRAR